MPSVMNEESSTLMAEGDSLHHESKLNGSGMNGQSEDSSPSNDSMDCGDTRGDTRGVQTITIGKGKDNMEGFELVTRNGKHQDEEESTQNGTSSNGAVENGDSHNHSAAGEEEDMETETAESKSEDGKGDKRVNDNDSSSVQGDCDKEDNVSSGDMAESAGDEENGVAADVDSVQDESGELPSTGDGPSKPATSSADGEEGNSQQSSSTCSSKNTDGEEAEPAPEEKSPQIQNGTTEEKASSESSKDLDEKVESTKEEVKVVPKDVAESDRKEKQSKPSVIIDVRTESEKSDRKAPPSPKKKQSKVDRMLANDKDGVSLNTGSENLRPFAKLLFDLGLDLAREQVYKELIKVQKKKHSNNQLGTKEEGQLDKLQDAYDHLVERNKPFSTEKHKCPRCQFKSDCVSALELHKEYEHNSMCAICGVTTKNIYSFYYHMESEHNRQGRVQPVMGQHICPFCPYEHHSSKKNFLKHLQKCESHFNLHRNLQPVPADCDIPLKLLPHQESAKKGTAPVRAPPPLQKKPEVRPMAGARPGAPVQQAKVNQAAGTRQVLIPPNLANWTSQDQQGPQLVQVGNQYYLLVQQNGQTFMTPMTGTVPAAAPKQVAKSPVQKPAATPQPSVVKTAPKTDDQSKFEICEICGGFVKDRESLRIHFFWAHKIELHPSVMREREATLKCDYCSNRFWTYQGHKKHIQLKHPSMKGASPTMTCYVCTQSVPDFITHMTSKHPQVVKHMLSQIRCVVCQDAFQSETALESHMLMDHKDVVTKYGSLGSPKASVGTLASGNKATPTPTGLFHNSTGARVCSRCPFTYTTPAAYRVHFQKTHSLEKEPCPICQQEVINGRPFISHVTEQHLKKLTVSLVRVDPKAAVTSSKRKRSEEVIVIDLDKSNGKKLKLDEEVSNEEREKVMEVVDDQDVADGGKDDKSPDSESGPVSGSPSPKKVIQEEIIDVDGEKVVVQKVDE